MLSEHLDEEELKAMLSDGGIDLDELTTIFAKIGRKLSTKEIEKFNKLDKNKNGKIEKYELGSVGEARNPAALLPLSFLGWIWWVLAG